MIRVKTSKKERLGTKIRIHVGLANPVHEIPDMNDEQGWELYQKAVVAVQRLVLHQAVLNDPTLPFAADRFMWSQNAGCSCGCSPGFIAETTGDEDYHLTEA